MSNLKQQLIRLGSSNPELKQHLRPILDAVTGTAVTASYRKRAAITENDVEQYFAEWSGPSSPIDGFVDWAWDARQDTLQKLNRMDDQLIDDITYSMKQEPQYRNLDEREMKPAIIEWLSDHKRELVRALGQGDEYYEASFSKRADGVAMAAERLVDHLNAGGDSGPDWYWDALDQAGAELFFDEDATDRRDRGSRSDVFVLTDGSEKYVIEYEPKYDQWEYLGMSA